MAKKNLLGALNDAVHRIGRPAPSDVGPLATAVTDCLGALSGARKRGIFNDPKWTVFKSLAVVLDSLQAHRDALYAAVDLVNYIESQESPNGLPKLILEFKAKAVKARLHQHVPRDLPEEPGRKSS